jgi:hypothetical protein
MKYMIVIPIFIALLTGCGTTGIVKLEQNHFMVSTKSAKVGFVNAAEEKADVYSQANDYCARFGKEVETINLEMRNSGFAKSASATLEFRCIPKQNNGG